jgi:hypothetical protein
MSTLFTGIISRFVKSCVSDLPEASREWVPLKRALFYLGVLLIYPVALIVAMVVIITIVVVAYPVSYIYEAVN